MFSLWKICNPITFFLVLATLGLVGCGSGSNAYPGPGDGRSFSAAYPAPSGAYPPPNGAPPSRPAIQKTPFVSSDSGAIVVQVLYEENGAPVRGQVFYAATLLPATAPGGEVIGYLPRLQADTAPRGESDEQGVVVISRILAGRYTLALATPMGYVFLWGDDAVVEETNFEVSAGVVTDLGKRTIKIPRNLFEP